MTGIDFRGIRKDCGLTQKEMAHLLRVHPTTVQGWEQGRRVIPGPVEVIMTMLFFEGEPTLNHLGAVAAYFAQEETMP